MLDQVAEKNIHIRISQLNDLVNTVIDLVEDSKLIPKFKENVGRIYQNRIKQIYQLQGQAVLNVYNVKEG